MENSGSVQDISLTTLIFPVPLKLGLEHSFHVRDRSDIMSSLKVRELAKVLQLMTVLRGVREKNKKSEVLMNNQFIFQLFWNVAELGPILTFLALL